jgi:hypothetical protein
VVLPSFGEIAALLAIGIDAVVLPFVGEIAALPVMGIDAVVFPFFGESVCSGISPALSDLASYALSY